MKKENKDIVCERRILGNSGKLVYSLEEEKTWKQHYESLLNVEFPWWDKDLSEADTVLGTTPVITQAIVEKYILKMKKHKTASASGVVTGKLKVASDTFSKIIADLKNSIICDSAIPCNQNVSIIISLFKGKGEILNLTECILKLIEQIIESFIHNIVKIDDIRFGFMNESDTIFIVRQAEESYIRKNWDLFFSFVDPEIAFDRVRRNILQWDQLSIVLVIQVMY